MTLVCQSGLLKVINHWIQLSPSHILFFTLPYALDTSYFDRQTTFIGQNGYITEIHSVLFSMKKSLKVPKNTVVNHLNFGQGYLIFRVGRPQGYGQHFTSFQHWDETADVAELSPGNYHITCLKKVCALEMWWDLLQATTYESGNLNHSHPQPRTV